MACLSWGFTALNGFFAAVDKGILSLWVLLAAIVSYRVLIQSLTSFGTLTALIPAYTALSNSARVLNFLSVNSNLSGARSLVLRLPFSVKVLTIKNCSFAEQEATAALMVINLALEMH